MTVLKVAFINGKATIINEDGKQYDLELYESDGFLHVAVADTKGETQCNGVSNA